MPRELSNYLDQETASFYREVLGRLAAADVEVLVGGAYAFAVYSGIERHTKDFDLFLRRDDYDRAAQVLTAAGYHTELAFSHWLGKAHSGAMFVDLIFSSGNGIARVDDTWFTHAVEASVLGVATKIIPAEEMIWSKGFIMERERYDGADVAHVLRARAEVLDWARLLRRLGPHWRVLLSHVVLFGFIYPDERAKIPAWVIDQLLDRLRDEMRTPPRDTNVCGGTILSREQYLHDLAHGYLDARLAPFGSMTIEQVALWTEGISEDGSQAQR